jgi:small subunit ribosomal protein S18
MMMADEPVTDNEVEKSEKDDRVEEDNGASRQKKRRQQNRPRQRTNRPTSEYRGQTGRFRPRRKVCTFCADKVKVIDWKNFASLRRFMNNNGSIRARRKTGTCAKHQRQLAVAIKRARHLALTPFTDEHTRLAGKN